MAMSILLLGSVPLLLAAQLQQATLTGTVRDQETGQPLAAAVVVLVDLDGGTSTDAAGRYVLVDVPPGPQHLSVRSPGYGTRTLHALVPGAGRLEINVSLRPEPILMGEVRVRSALSLPGIEDDDSVRYPDRGMTLAAVRNHPQLAEPDVLLALDGGAVALMPEAPSGVHILGGAADHTAYLIDNVPVFSPYHVGGLFSALNPDALARLDLSAFSASPASPPALSGTIAAITRTPGSSFRSRGAMSTTHARATVDGPLGSGGAGYLLGLRASVLNAFAPGGEASYLRGKSGDWLGKIELSTLGGELRLLGYGSGNEMSAASIADAPDANGFDSARNGFEWESESVGRSGSASSAVRR